MWLKKKNIKNHWLEMSKDFKVKIDYPSREQEQRLQDLMLDLIDDEKKTGRKEELSFYREIVKYTVKDWDGVDEKCELVNDGNLETVMSDRSWWELVRIPTNALVLGQKIYDEISWTETDKKK